MKKLISILIFCLISLCFKNVYTQTKKAFEIYSYKGKKVSYKKLINRAKSADVVLFGEYHDNPISHWLEFELAKDLLSKHKIVIGAEMLEADDQKLLDNFLKDDINLSTFDSIADLWSNFETDYLPIINLAKENNVPVIATNIPRKYARKVYREGGFSALDLLSKEEKKYIAPLPILFDPELPQYKNMLDMMGGHEMTDIVKAQAIKDATMAYFIQKNTNENSIFFHINGAYHSDFKEGIYWYLKQLNSNINCLTVSTVKEENINKFNKENKSRADFIIVVDSDMNSTY
ncbi:MAG: iron-regulated protein [Crocinitomicaceae bacterium]|nr:iron-regulated protein [Crocinitomicaceae bacterium]|tara:strand:+ start:213 stop:1079 length:867 start_codon:yes stop_codon:yes gene_type:complete